MLTHPIPPVFDGHSRVLILGSFPSVKSRQAQFFYGHPQNRFWPLMAALFDDNPGNTPQEKTVFLLRHYIALWDVIAACDIDGSADSTIKNVTPNDLGEIFDKADIRAVFTNGKTADRLYRRYLLKNTGRSAVCLPSTSPANARWTLPLLKEAWGAAFSENGILTLDNCEKV